MVEAVTNTALGFGVNLLLSAVIYPLYGGEFSWPQLWQLTAIFTAISIVRGYGIRRLFNWVQGRTSVEDNRGYRVVTLHNGTRKMVGFKDFIRKETDKRGDK